MTREEGFRIAKQEIIGDNPVIRSVADADDLHRQFIKLRSRLFMTGIIEVMPHYRGEQNYGWDIHSGIFRPPLVITDPQVGKDLERFGMSEFEKAINTQIGPNALRSLFYKEKFGKEWDLLFQAQHAGVRTTLTDWSAEILSGLYFASEESTNGAIEDADGQLWCFLIPNINILGHNDYPERDTFYDLDPFDMKGTYMINPSSYLSDIEDRVFEYRMFRQKGRFVMPANGYCHIPLNKQAELQPYMFQVRVPAACKQGIREELAAIGVVRAHMYVDENPARQGLINDINASIFARK